MVTSIANIAVRRFRPWCDRLAEMTGSKSLWTANPTGPSVQEVLEEEERAALANVAILSNPEEMLLSSCDMMVRKWAFILDKYLHMEAEGSELMRARRNVRKENLLAQPLDEYEELLSRQANAVHAACERASRALPPPRQQSFRERQPTQPTALYPPGFRTRLPASALPCFDFFSKDRSCMRGQYCKYSHDRRTLDEWLRDRPNRAHLFSDSSAAGRN